VRLNPIFRFAIYAVVLVLFATGIVWLIVDQLKEPSGDELWQWVSADALMLHGGTAMLTLLLLGALFPLHIQRGWRARKNRIIGALMCTTNTVLIVTAFGLYYAGSETVRPWASNIHIGAGIILPALLFIHIRRGRRLRAANAVNETGT